MNPVGQTLIAMEPTCVYVLLPISVHKLSVTHCNEATGAYLLFKSLQAVTNCCKIAYVGGHTSLRSLQSYTVAEPVDAHEMLRIAVSLLSLRLVQGC